MCSGKISVLFTWFNVTRLAQPNPCRIGDTLRTMKSLQGKNAVLAHPFNVLTHFYSVKENRVHSVMDWLRRTERVEAHLSQFGTWIASNDQKSPLQRIVDPKAGEGGNGPGGGTGGGGSASGRKGFGESGDGGGSACGNCSGSGSGTSGDGNHPSASGSGDSSCIVSSLSVRSDDQSEFEVRRTTAATSPKHHHDKANSHTQRYFTACLLSQPQQMIHPVDLEGSPQEPGLHQLCLEAGISNPTQSPSYLATVQVVSANHHLLMHD